MQIAEPQFRKAEGKLRVRGPQSVGDHEIAVSQFMLHMPPPYLCQTTVGRYSSPDCAGSFDAECELSGQYVWHCRTNVREGIGIVRPYYGAPVRSPPVMLGCRSKMIEEVSKRKEKRKCVQ